MIVELCDLAADRKSRILGRSPRCVDVANALAWTIVPRLGRHAPILAPVRAPASCWRSNGLATTKRRFTCDDFSHLSVW